MSDASNLRTRLAEALVGGSGEGTQMLEEQLARSDLSVEILKESLTRLELAQEDAGWRRMAKEVEREFTRQGLDDICELARAMYLAHPLINRSVNVTTFYVFAQGIQFKAKDPTVQKIVLDKTMGDDGNRAELFSHQAMILTDVQQLNEGNLFLALYTDMRGDVEIRSFPTNQIREIFHKTGDSQMVTYYLRRWSEVVFDEVTGQKRTETREALYPDWRYHPRAKRSRIGDMEVRWDCPILHQKTGGMKDMQFGIPETYAALDWARAYRKFLENWHTLIASLSKFAWQFETKGKNIQGAKEKLASTIDQNDEGREENEMPAGQALVAKKGDKLVPIPKTGAATSAEDGRPSRLMVASATNIPDTMLANDPQQGALATAKTLDRPTELYIKSRQQMYSDMYNNIFRYIIDRKIESGLLPGHEVWNERKGTMEFIVDGDMDKVSVTFPPILEHDIESAVRAIVTAATLEGRETMHTIPKALLSRLLMETLHVPDIEEAVKMAMEEEESELQEKVKDLSDQLAMAGKNGPGFPGKDPEEE